MEERETFNVYSFRMFLHMLNLGFKPVGTKQQEENPKYTIFFFEDTPEIRKAALDYSNKYKKVH